MFPQRAQAFWETAARDASDASRPAVPFSMPRHEEPFPSILHFLQILQSSFLLLLFRLLLFRRLASRASPTVNRLWVGSQDD